jgi:hypothetical protein
MGNTQIFHFTEGFDAFGVPSASRNYAIKKEGLSLCVGYLFVEQLLIHQ